MTAQQLNFDTMGRLSAAVLDQTKWWRDGTGAVRLLEDLDRDHLARLEPFLLRKGEGLCWRWLMWQGIQHTRRAPAVIGVREDGTDVLHWGESGQGFLLFSDDGGNLDHAFEEWEQHEMDRPLAEWLADRPLVKKIRELLQ